MAPKRNVKVAKRKSYGKVWLAIVVIALIILGAGIYITMAGNQPPPPIQPTKVLLETTAGNITIDLRTDKPITSQNFINLVQQGKYDNTTFHRVVKGFVIQGGQVSGNIAAIKDEIGSNNRNTNYTIAMAKTSSPNSATSEFFINVADNGNLVVDQQGHKFDEIYTQFGTVIAGRDVVDTIAQGATTQNPYIPGEMSIPVNPVSVIRATIVP